MASALPWIGNTEEELSAAGPVQMSSIRTLPPLGAALVESHSRTFEHRAGTWIASHAVGLQLLFVSGPGFVGHLLACDANANANADTINEQTQAGFEQLR